jgi:hypothetical protein
MSDLPTSNELLLDRLEDAVRADNEALHSWNGHKRDKIIAKQSERAAARAAVIAAMRAAHEPADDLYALLVRRGYAQHEAHAIAFGEKLAALSSSQPPSAVLVNAFRAGAFYGCAEEFNPLDLQRDAEAYGSRHSPTKGDAL